MSKKLDLKVIKTSSDGNVKVSINGKIYDYSVGGHQVLRFLDLMKRTPGKALAYIKKVYKANSNEDQKLVDKILLLWEGKTVTGTRHEG